MRGERINNMTEKFKFKFDISTITIIMYALYAIKCVWLAFASIDYSPVFYYIMQIPLALALGFGLLMLLTDDVKIPDNKFLIGSPFIFFIYSLARAKEDTNYAQIIFTLVIILLFVFFKSEIKIAIFDVFYWIIQICNVVSLLFFICYVLNINIGFSIVNYYSETIHASYVKWLIFAIYKSSSELRLCGIFNEPGALGTVCALLFAARCNHSKAWEKILLILTIAVTYSLAGYLILFIYLAIFLIKKDARFIILIMGGFLLFLALPNIDWGNEQLNYFFGRFAITENGIAGDNRTNKKFDLYYDQFQRSKDYLWGIDEMPDYYQISSYKTNVLKYGIIGFGFWIFMWIISALKNINKEKNSILFLLCFILSLYQRPGMIESIYGYVILFGGIIWIKHMNEENKVVYSDDKGNSALRER